ncbi:hypothetical protein AMATHDRAFT_64610 [Amanita thiersii Skay4041]|uniref:Uncharacterized protein n=1 Tax=Amanita thiersii Skay4041 TaxID=703135 RepID=A0A2A9NHI8_9AGAR|nr:hypothetical protein AMATHDRAFT_64610 [Amanita thiersii Skay4041]
MVPWKQFLLSSSWVANLIPTQIPFPSNTPTANQCFSTAKTLGDIVACHRGYVVRTYTQETYDAAQPTDEQRNAWSIAVSSILNTDGNCTAVGDALPDPLKDIYNVFELTESSGSFCVLAEQVAEGDKTYQKGWGLMVVPSTRGAVSRHVHIAAPFPRFALQTEEQSTVIFKGVGAKSLFIPGRQFRSYPQQSLCILSTATTTYYKTDPVHDKDELFFDTYQQIINWQNANGGCPSASCAYVSLSGKGASSCKLDQVFISAGLSESTGWYTEHEDYPAKRIQSNLVDEFPFWKISLPSDSNCDLVATKNIVGRMINGVNASDVCSEAASPESTLGQFVHIEQSMISRYKEFYSRWANAILKSFDPTCESGMVEDGATGLCVKK